MNREQKARDLMAAIRYQVFRPEVTTMGACAECGKSSRGAGKCADCLAVELDAVLPPGQVWPDGALGRMYLHACNMQRSAERAVLDALKRRKPPDSSIAAHVATGDC